MSDNKIQNIDDYPSPIEYNHEIKRRIYRKTFYINGENEPYIIFEDVRIYKVNEKANEQIEILTQKNIPFRVEVSISNK